MVRPPECASAKASTSSMSASVSTHFSQLQSDVQKTPTLANAKPGRRPPTSAHGDRPQTHARRHHCRQQRPSGGPSQAVTLQSTRVGAATCATTALKPRFSHPFYSQSRSAASAAYSRSPSETRSYSATDLPRLANEALPSNIRGTESALPRYRSEVLPGTAANYSHTGQDCSGKRALSCLKRGTSGRSSRPSGVAMASLRGATHRTWPEYVMNGGVR